MYIQTLYVTDKMKRCIRLVTITTGSKSQSLTCVIFVLFYFLHNPVFIHVAFFAFSNISSSCFIYEFKW